MADIPTPDLGPVSTGLEVIIHPTASKRGAVLQQVVRYAEKLAEGSGARDAARAAGTTVGAMRLQGRAVQKYLVKARANFTATADEIRELTILQWVQRALKEPYLDDGVTPNRDYDARESMAALRELSLIPEVGLKGKSAAIAATVELSEETRAVLDNLNIQDGEE